MLEVHAAHLSRLAAAPQLCFAGEAAYALAPRRRPGRHGATRQGRGRHALDCLSGSVIAAVVMFALGFVFFGLLGMMMFDAARRRDRRRRGPGRARRQPAGDRHLYGARPTRRRGCAGPARGRPLSSPPAARRRHADGDGHGLRPFPALAASADRATASRRSAAICPARRRARSSGSALAACRRSCTSAIRSGTASPGALRLFEFVADAVDVHRRRAGAGALVQCCASECGAAA